MSDLVSAIRYCLSVLVGTAYYGLKVIFASFLGVPYRSGGVYDTATVWWGRFLLRANHLVVTADGRERLTPGQPYVFVSNHCSWVDIWALVDVLPSSPKFIAKKEFRRMPVIGRAMRDARHFFIDRQRLRSAMEAYQEAADGIRSGLSAIVFAEGTRSRTGQMLPFKKGPFVLAIAAQVPVVPVLIEGTFKVMPKGSLVIRPGPIRVHVGEPIPTTGLSYEDRDALSGRCRDAILAMHDAVGNRGSPEPGTGGGRLESGATPSTHP